MNIPQKFQILKMDKKEVILLYQKSCLEENRAEARSEIVSTSKKVKP